MNKRFYIIIATFFPRPNSCRYPFGFDYVSAIKRDGRYEVVLLMPGLEGDYNYKGVHVYSLPWERPWKASIPDFVTARANARNFYKKLLQLNIELDDIAVIEAYNEEFGFCGWSAKRKNPSIVLALHHHSLWSIGVRNKRWLNRVLDFWWMKKIHTSQDFHLFISELSRKSLLNFPKTEWAAHVDYRAASKGLGWMSPVRIKGSYVLYNGVDKRLFHPNGESIKTGFTIGAVANFHEYKGLMTLLGACSLLKSSIPDIRVRIIGSGQQKDDLVRAISKYGLEENVALLPEVEHELLPEFYRSLDLFVLPSYFEGFGCVYTEAWSCGVPFMACLEGNGIAECVDPKERAWWLITPGDEVGLAKRILEYKECRRVQHLCVDTDIDILVPSYLDSLTMNFR